MHGSHFVPEPSPHISYITLAGVWSYSVSDFHIKSQSKS
uniref:Uncharacterized protein n=1 Tax=Anguilla anguilla TaxID=7936 RepID=A0A0E9U6D1_ANGAN